jgi:hypothetical protein
MTTCRNCGAELPDQANFCHLCGASQTVSGDQEVSRVTERRVVMSKIIFYSVIIALALMGLVVTGLVIRGPGTVTQVNYVTKTQLATVSVSFTSSAIMTATSTMTVASFTTLSAGQANWFNQQYCGYPFNPYLCNEGPPVTVSGSLTSDASCVNLYVDTGQTYVVWNLPKKYPDGAYHVYGFVYPDWPQTQPFPPYPFQRTVCIGIPMWAIPPYIQSA